MSFIKADKRHPIIVEKMLSNQIKQESVRPRWPYDMRPSARAEKYMCVIVIR